MLTENTVKVSQQLAARSFATKNVKRTEAPTTVAARATPAKKVICMCEFICESKVR